MPWGYSTREPPALTSVDLSGFEPPISAMRMRRFTTVLWARRRYEKVDDTGFEPVTPAM